MQLGQGQRRAPASICEPSHMRTNPEVGLRFSLGVALLAAAWICAQAIASDALFAQLGYAMHAMTLFAIFLLVSGIAVAMLFRHFARVRRDLMEGRDVLARWTIDAATWSRFVKPAQGMERGEKLGLLLTMYGMIVLVCGGLAIAVPDDAHIFGGIALGIAALVTAGFLLGQRVYATQLQYRGGEVVIGTRGLLVNGVLHVWGAWLSWLEGARVREQPPMMLEISYAFWARYGPQSVAVRIPVSASDLERARVAEAGLNAAAGLRQSARRKRVDARA